MRHAGHSLTIAVMGIALAHPALAQSQPPFTFTKPDIQLFEECEALDKQFERRGLVYHDAAVEKHLAGIAGPFLPAAPPERVAWHFRILRDPIVNAFALPNGSVYVTGGLMARLENDDQLAGVIARDVAHTVDRHAYLFNRVRRKEAVALEAIRRPGPFAPMTYGSMAVVGGMSPPLAILMVQGYGETMEEQADSAALDELKQAGRDPAQLVRAFTLLDYRLEPEPALFAWRDRPKFSEHLAYLKKSLRLAQDPPPGADAGYCDTMRPVLLQTIRLDLDTRRFRSALAASQRLVQASPENSENLFWLAESYRYLGPRTPLPSAAETTFWSQVSAYRQWIGQTEEEETRKLTATPEGRAALDDNQHKAEEAYRKAAALDPAEAQPYLGLGMLFEQEHKADLAVEAYRKYLEMSPNGVDKDRVERRIAALASTIRDGFRGGSQ